MYIFNPDKLTELRTKENMTTYELAERTGTKQSYVSGIENRTRIPNVNLLGVYADFFGVSANEFYVNANSKKSE